MNASRLVLVLILSTSVSACVTVGGQKPLDNKQIDYRAAAHQVPSLEVPPDLTAPTSDDRFVVPDVGGATSYSDYSNRGGNSTSGSSASVLKPTAGVSLERNGEQRWLKTQATPEQVWSVLLSFWPENGITIKTQDQAAGVMETDWVENRAKIPQGGLRQVIGKVFDNIYSSSERDMYRVRLERSSDGQNTEVYITHRGMQEVGEPGRTQWQARPDDHELAAIMLQRLMVKLGGDNTNSTPASRPSAVSAPTASVEQPIAAATVSAAEAIPEVEPAVVTPAPTAETTPSAKPPARGALVINEPFDRAWRRVGLAIESAGLQSEDKDRSRGVYYLSKAKTSQGLLEKMSFWKKANDADRYQVVIRDEGTNSKIQVLNQYGRKDEVADELLGLLYQHMSR